MNRSLDDTTDAGKKAGGKGGIGGLVSSMGAAVPIIGAVAIGAIGAAGALIEMSKGALEDKRQADTLALTLSKIPGVTQAMIDKNADWIDSMQLATLVSDTDLRVAVSKLALATGDLTKAQNLVALSADVAAGSGKNFATVSEAMAKAAAGNTAQLERMFPWLDKNKDGTVSLAEATKGLGEKFKGAAAEAAKNDPWKRIGIIFDELKEAIGGALLPVLKRLGDWFASKANQDKVKEFLDTVSRLATKVGNDLVDALDDLVRWLKKPENMAKVQEWAESMRGFASAIGAAAEAIGPLISALEKLKRITDLLPSNIILRAIGLLPGGHSAPSSPAAMGMSATSTATTAAAAPPPTVIVTEEQVYRAVQRLLLRGQARNGRLVMVG